MDGIEVRRATEQDLQSMAEINSSLFSGDRGNPEKALVWMKCWLCAYPLYQYFVLLKDGEVKGYVGWQFHGGFSRPEPVLELEQVGIDASLQRQGLGPKLIQLSLVSVVDWVKENNDRLGTHITITVWGYASNLAAMKAYFRLFTDGVRGMRVQYGDDPENMLRWRHPVEVPGDRHSI